MGIKNSRISPKFDELIQVSNFSHHPILEQGRLESGLWVNNLWDHWIYLKLECFRTSGSSNFFLVFQNCAVSYPLLPTLPQCYKKVKVHIESSTFFLLQFETFFFHFVFVIFSGIGRLHFIQTVMTLLNLLYKFPEAWKHVNIFSYEIL